MSRFIPSLKNRALVSRLGPLLLLFQRTPLVQWLLPEARVASGAGLGEITRWTVATVAGLGVFDSVAGATSTVTAPAITSQPSSTTINSGGTATLTVGVNGTNVYLQWYKGTRGNTTSPVAGATSTSSTTSKLTATTSYWVLASNTAGYAYSDTATVTVRTPPAITRSPASVTINSGGTTTLTVTATGTSPTFQWYRGNSGVTSSPVNGATGSSFTTPALTTSTRYWVRARNAAGKADSTAATVTVRIAPSITLQPVATTIGSGTATTLRVAASGTSPTFQWYAGNSGITTNPISGATGTSFTTPALTATRTYWVRASNPAGIANSKAATVTVLPAPNITGQPASVTIRKSASTTLTVAATGQAPVTWQWYLGNPGVTTNPVIGATDATFTTPALTADTTYWVRITDASWHTDSQAATVSIARFVLTTSGPHGTVTGAGTYVDMTAATLNATPAAGYVFSGWTGDASGTANPLPLVVDSAKAVGATFSPDLADNDGDGLSNYQEIVVTKTNPNKADTDGDRLTDGQEANLTHTNPLLSDTNGNGVSDALEDPDKDGLTNFAEVRKYHTNPRLADSNADGLSDTFVACFVGTAVQPRVGNQISINLKRLTVTGNTLNLTGTLPAGLVFNATTGVISGTITATPGIYPLTIQVLQGTTVLRKISFKIPVLAFPASLVGNFESILENANSVPIGACKIAITGADQWTATFESPGAAKRKAAGTFILKQGSPVAPINAAFPAATGVPAVTVQVSISGTAPTFTGTCTGGTLRGFRLATGLENPPAAVGYNLVLDAGVQDGVTIPAGLGWMKGSVSNLGLGKFSGLLGDGTPANITLHLSATGQAILWVQPYANKNSYLGGIITLANLGQAANSSTPLTDSVWWSKAADAATPSYPAGIPAMPVTVGTSRWTLPATATELGASLGWRNDRTAAVTIDGAGLSNHEPQATSSALPTEFTLDDAFNLATSAPLDSPAVGWSGTANAADGSFAGSLTIPAGFSPDILAGTATASGVMVQDAPWGTVTGCGLIKVPVSGAAGSFKTAAMIFNQ